MPEKDSTSQEIPCDICGSDKREPFLHAPGKGGTENISIVKCSQCGMIYMSPRVIINYEEREGEGETFDIHENLNIFLHYYRIITGWAPFEGRFLEIGCGPGYLLDFARANGFETVGIDPWPEQVRIARRYLVLNVIEGKFPEYKFEAKSFDIIAFTEVVEHVPSPTAFLTEVYRILKDDGIIFLTTPNIESKMFKKMRERWTPLIGEHLFYFSADTLKKMFEKTGFKPLDLTTGIGLGVDDQLLCVAAKDAGYDAVHRRINNPNYRSRDMVRYLRLKNHWFFGPIIRMGNHFINKPEELL